MGNTTNIIPVKTDVTATYTLTYNDNSVEATANSFATNLPTAVGIKGKTYNIKNSGSGTITVTPDGSETIDGSATKDLAQYEVITVVSNGTNWIIVDNSIDNGGEANPAVVSQAEAEAGTATDERIWTSERVKQAIDALGAGGDVTSSTTITDNAIVRGDGGSKGVQESTASISDTGVLTVPALGTGGFAEIDVQVGGANYGMVDLGNATFGRTNRVNVNLDLDGTVVLINKANPSTSNILFAMMDGTNSMRFALPQSGVGNATYNPRSMLIAGPTANDDTIVTVGYWQTQGIFDNLVCDTDTDGADLGVQNDLEVEGDIFVDSILESTSATGVTIDGVLIKDGLVDGVDVSTLTTPTLSKGITIPDPVATDDATIFFTPVAITITDVRSHITGTTNVVFNIGHATTRTGTQLDVFTSDITLTSTAGQSNSTGFNDATIPANSWVWLDVVSVSGTPTMFHCTIIYTED